MEKSNTVNVDSGEVEKFNEIAHKWWDPTSEFKPLHDINPLRVNYINQKSSLNGKKVLDVGCGGGILTESMAKLGANVVGIDQSDIAIKIAKLHAKESTLNIDYKQLNIESFSDKHKNKYDVITCLEMIEHVPDPSSIINKCSELISPKGTIYLSTINRNIKSFLFAIVGAEYILQLLPKGTHEYKKFIKPSEINQWASKNGLEITSVIGMTYNPLIKKYSLNNDTSVNYMLELRKIND
jgi:2-polyprenyl-6-hydroxyphenyl methylase/3-demethylubiquinone-9 3-methyltransferase